MTTSTVSRPTDEQAISSRFMVRYIAFLEEALLEIPEEHPLHREFTDQVDDLRACHARPLGVLSGRPEETL